MHDHKGELTEEEQESSRIFLDALKSCGYKSIPSTAPLKPDIIKAMKEVWVKKYYLKKKNISLHYVVLDSFQLRKKASQFIVVYGNFQNMNHLNFSVLVGERS